MKKVWFIYILECSDGTLYTGITNDLDKRIATHNAGKGAKYTKGRGPVKLRFCFMHSSKSSASKREVEIKGWTKEGKISHIQYWSEGRDRIMLSEVINILKEQGWKTDWKLDESTPENDSTYTTWEKDGHIIYMGNYYLQGEKIGAFPWADSGVKKENIIALLNGDRKTAELY
jgi:putative endonuclease